MAKYPAVIGEQKTLSGSVTPRFASAARNSGFVRTTFAASNSDSITGGSTPLRSTTETMRRAVRSATTSNTLAEVMTTSRA